MTILAVELARFAAKAAALAAFLYFAGGLWVFYPAPVAYAFALVGAP